MVFLLCLGVVRRVIIVMDDDILNIKEMEEIKILMGSSMKRELFVKN